MMRGTFANIRIRNEMVPGVEGGMTRHLPDSEVISIYIWNSCGDCRIV